MNFFVLLFPLFPMYNAFYWNDRVFIVLNKQSWSVCHKLNFSLHICNSCFVIWTVIPLRVTQGVAVELRAVVPSVPLEDGLQRRKRDVTFACWSHGQPVKYLSWMAELLDSECRNPAGVCTLISQDKETQEWEQTNKPLQELHRNFICSYRNTADVLWWHCGSRLTSLCFDAKTFLIRGEYVGPGTETQRGNIETFSCVCVGLNICMYTLEIHWEILFKIKVAVLKVSERRKKPQKALKHNI